MCSRAINHTCNPHLHPILKREKIQSFLFHSNDPSLLWTGPPSNKPHCLPLTTTCGPPKLNPFTLFSFWVSKSLRKPDGFLLRGGPVLKQSGAVFREMECRDDENGGKGEMFSDTMEECRESSLSCETSTSTSEEKQSSDETEESESKESGELGSPVQKR